MTLRGTKLSAAACLIAAGFGTALPAAAADWMAWEGQDAAAPLAIYAEDTGNHGALLTCGADGNMSAVISLSPATIPDLMKKNAPYGRSAAATVSVGDGEPSDVTVRYVPAINAIETRTHTVAAKLFNSVVLGESLNLSVEREGDLSSQFPAANDTFKAFAKTCKILREQADA